MDFIAVFKVTHNVFAVINSLAPGECDSNFKCVILTHIIMVDILISCKITHSWMPQGDIDGDSTLVQVMDWATRQQAITRTNVDTVLWHHMAFRGADEFIVVYMESPNYMNIYICCKCCVYVAWFYQHLVHYWHINIPPWVEPIEAIIRIQCWIINLTRLKTSMRLK